MRTADENSYWIFERFGGCRPYLEITENNENEPEWEMNCLEYALNIYDTTEWLSNNIRDGLSNNFTTINDMMIGNAINMGMKQYFEQYVLDEYLSGKYTQVFSSVGGEDIHPNYNQWLIAYRIGMSETGYLDYHFWYRTNNGQWTNKHGDNSASQLLSDIPTDDNSIGWRISEYSNEQYYDSIIIYYLITE